MDSVWVMGDQINRGISSLKDRSPGECRVLFVVSDAKVASKRWHRQRLHELASAMAHFAEELRAEGFDVDERRAASLADGVHAHVDEFGPGTLTAMEPMSWDGRELLGRLAVELAPTTELEVTANNQFLCSYEEFAEWAGARKSFKMEDFYRWQRTRLDVLMDPGAGDKLVPTAGQWNFDKDNREPPPKDGRAWPKITSFPLDAIDHKIIETFASPDADAVPDAESAGNIAEVAGVDSATWGAVPDGTWPVTRAQALTRLDEFVATGLGPFGPHEDAMLAAEWKLAHSVLSSAMNLGLLHPGEVVEAAEAAYRAGDAPINSVEGFVRQVMGWREYVWGVYWLWMEDGYRDKNVLEATRPVPPAFTGAAKTDMACVSSVVSHLHDHGYTHHIERLMVLGNLALTAGVDPQAMTQWMWASFVDGAEWVMLPNVIGMALFADGGMMATKPYASGGAYINKMGDSCKGCRYDPKKRVGDDACPYTTLYWDFLARNEDKLAGNHRLGQQLAGMRRLSNLEEVRERAVEVLVALDEGRL